MNTGGAKPRLLAGFALYAFVFAAMAQQDYPNKPIRYITPFAPGGSQTVLARLIGHRLTEAWGQQVVVDNRPGANTIIGTQLAVRSRPDGYTLLSLGNVLASNHTLYKTPYDALRDIAPIATVLTYENVLVVGPALPVTSVRELIEAAKAKPGHITFGSSSAGGSTHLLAELFSIIAAIKTQHIPYKGGGPVVTDLMGGHIHMFFSNPINVISQVKSGRLRALAVTGKSRVPAFADAPTFAELGMPAITLTNWQGVGGPVGIPKPIIDKISAEIAKLVAMPDTKEKFATQGFEPYYNNAEQTAALLKADIAKYAKIIKDANIKVEALER